MNQPTPSVHIEFDSTLDDAVEAQLLALRQSGSLRRSVLYNSVIYGLFGGLLIYVIIPDSVAVKATFAAALFLVMCLVLPSVLRRSTRKNVRLISRDLRGTDGPIRMKVSADHNGIEASWSGISVRCEWTAVRSIDHGPEAVEILGDHSVNVRIPNKRVAPSDLAAFVQQARAFRASAGGSWSRFSHRACAQCGYNLFGLHNETCPECGTAITVGTPSNGAPITTPDFGDLFDAHAYYAAGHMPWSFAGYDDRFADHKGLPTDPELLAFLALLQSRGVRFGIWRADILPPGQRWLVVPIEAMPHTVKVIEDIQESGVIPKGQLSRLSERLSSPAPGR